MAEVGRGQFARQALAIRGRKGWDNFSSYTVFPPTTIIADFGRGLQQRKFAVTSKPKAKPVAWTDAADHAPT